MARNMNKFLMKVSLASEIMHLAKRIFKATIKLITMKKLPNLLKTIIGDQSNLYFNLEIIFQIKKKIIFLLLHSYAFYSKKKKFLTKQFKIYYKLKGKLFDKLLLLIFSYH